MEQYRIEWKYLNNAAQGCGQWHNSKELLEESILYYNDKYKGKIYHWMIMS